MTYLEQIHKHLDQLPVGALILDAGGWFQPLAAATHVVDMMPYETRRCMISVEPMPGEKFTRQTWHQVDFVGPGMQLPFADHQFEFAYCGQTLEDLIDPAPLLRELQRVSRTGCITCPSRLTEQTRGVRDRTCDAPGHPHHCWIVDKLKGGLRFCAKAESIQLAAACLPLRHFERNAAGQNDEERRNVVFFWTAPFDFIFESGAAATERALAFAASEHVRFVDRALDPLVRRLRVTKHRLLGRRPKTFEADWPHILELSRPFSRIPL